MAHIERIEASPVPDPIKVANAAPIHLTEPLRAIPELVGRYGFRRGNSKSEQHTDYYRVIDIDIGDHQRLIVCRDQLQIIHQKRRGTQWQSLSFHQTLNPQLRKILDESF